MGGDAIRFAGQVEDRARDDDDPSSRGAGEVQEHPRPDLLGSRLFHRRRAPFLGLHIPPIETFFEQFFSGWCNGEDSIIKD